jgi:hypothetical protein
MIIIVNDSRVRGAEESSSLAKNKQRERLAIPPTNLQKRVFVSRVAWAVCCPNFMSILIQDVMSANPKAARTERSVGRKGVSIFAPAPFSSAALLGTDLPRYADNAVFVCGYPITRGTHTPNLRWTDNANYHSSVSLVWGIHTGLCVPFEMLTEGFLHHPPDLLFFTHQRLAVGTDRWHPRLCGRLTRGKEVTQEATEHRYVTCLHAATTTANCQLTKEFKHPSEAFLTHFFPPIFFSA